MACDANHSIPNEAVSGMSSLMSHNGSRRKEPDGILDFLHCNYLCVYLCHELVNHHIISRVYHVADVPSIKEESRRPSKISIGNTRCSIPLRFAKDGSIDLRSNSSILEREKLASRNLDRRDWRVNFEDVAL